MERDQQQPKMPLSLFALLLVGTALILSSLLIMYVVKPAPSDSPRLSEILGGIGVVCDLVFAFRCWRWLRSIRTTAQPRI